MKTEMYVCDNAYCKLQSSQPAKDGWMIARVGEAIHVYPQFSGTPVEGREDDSIKILHLCGASCALKVVSKFLEEKTK